MSAAIYSDYRKLYMLYIYIYIYIYIHIFIFVIDVARWHACYAPEAV